MLEDGERKLVTIREISEISPISNSDFLEVATVDGWQVVVKKGEFQLGDKCLYFEIDSAIPAVDPRFDFLKKSCQRTWHDKEIYRIKTVKLRGQISQGLALPLSEFPELTKLENGQNIDELLGVEKWEYEEPNSSHGFGFKIGKTAGDRPDFIPKTDEERIQNLFKKYQRDYRDVQFAKSLKLDGSSISVAMIKKPEMFIRFRTEYPHQTEFQQFLVCSRNQLKKDENCSFWEGVKNEQLFEKLSNWPGSLVVQGELMGPGIQKNREKLTQCEVFAFRIWFPEQERFATHDEFVQICSLLNIKTVPQLGICKPFQECESVQELLKQAEISSLNNPTAEGIVFKSVDNIDGEMIHFKVINNKFLLGEE